MEKVYFFPFEVFILLFWINFNTSQVRALYFARNNDEVTLPVGCNSPHNILYTGYVLRSGNELPEDGIHFRLEDQQSSSTSPSTSASSASSGFFGVRAPSNGQTQTFEVFLLHQIPNTKRPLAVVICAKSSDDNGVHRSPCMSLKIKFISVVKYCSDAAYICFGQTSSFAVTLHENSPLQAIARLGQNQCGASKCPSTSLNISLDVVDWMEVEDEVFRLNDDSSLELVSMVNREALKDVSLVVKCEVVLDNGQVLRADRKGMVTIKDQNEHGPVVINDPPIINFTLDEGIDKLLGCLIAVKDGDSEPSTYLVEILDDVKGFFNVSYDTQLVGKFEHNPFEFRIVKAILHQNRPVEYDGNSYTFRIRFEDVNLANPDVPREAEVSVVMQKHVSQMGDPSILDNIVGQEFEAELLRSAANHSRVQVKHMLSEELRVRSGVRFFLEQDEASLQQSGLPFDVTPFHGVVYVNDTHSLRRLNSSQVFRMKMSWRARVSGEESLEQLTHNHNQYASLGFVYINVNILPGEEMDFLLDGKCGREKMCSVYNNGEECALGCGPGATKGFCQWRATDSSYATCSPDVSTCPDNRCDELESLFHHLCPQDCILSKNVYGGRASPVGGQAYGIPAPSTGVCTCTYTSRCDCYSPPPINKDNRTESDDAVSPKMSTGSSSIVTTVYKPHLGGVHERPETSVCNWDCVLSIVTVSVILVVLGAASVICCQRRYGRKLRGEHKFPGSLVSLPAVPSEYVDERSSSVVSQNLLVTNDLLGFSNKLWNIDSKWEFPRSRLILEQTLGEGEFGRVVKAKALNLSLNQPGYTTVAVKMLKSNGSSSEQDLMSEFNLLKEVCHPNVIRLLGICVDKEGPLCIIVEYAEFGALRTFLRKSRRLEFKSCTSDDSGVDSMANGVQSEPQDWNDYQVNARDLLSFCWQISKGMEYLSVIKLVHRDLAARNILVAANKAVKISDFGMTRDVYEGDTYFKKSMGRVPVKWLAIESLLDHIYTTKSDVWSYGIVLWEIVTLGAAPYPGVAPERLYHLLKSGYRMEKPDNCSDELYDIMRRCWRESPSERPAFTELTKIFDQMLQANVEYLDLGVNIVHNLTYFEDIAPQTETIDEEDSEMGYGSWNALPNDDDDQYLTSNPSCRVQTVTRNDKSEETLLLAKPLVSSKTLPGVSRVDEHVV